ncbi:MAG: DUF447 family protein [Planctomycetes bacterium]|nr:DUF447 family protein [Planctomycetota bacterium]
MVLEGLLTTLNADGTVNIAPMGPIVEETMRRMTLRPYHTSHSYANLQRTGQGVFHVTDDVLLLAKSCIDKLGTLPTMRKLESFPGMILTGACRWYALQIESIDDSQPRITMEARVVDSGTQREFFGLNRAKHAVLEAAILASRVGLLTREEILQQFPALATMVQKTGGPAEHEALQLLETYVRTTSHGDIPG